MWCIIVKCVLTANRLTQVLVKYKFHPMVDRGNCLLDFTSSGILILVALNYQGRVGLSFLYNNIGKNNFEYGVFYFKVY